MGALIIALVILVLVFGALGGIIDPGTENGGNAINDFAGCVNLLICLA